MTSEPVVAPRAAVAATRPHPMSWKSRWPEWVALAAAAWSLLYGLLGLFWTFGGGGFPFGKESDWTAEGASLWESARQESTAPVIAVLGFVTAAVAVALARLRHRGPASTVLIGVGWLTAGGLAVGIPDYRSLMAVARLPIFIVGKPFGWPDDVGLFGPGMFSWPVINQIVAIAGGALWAAAALTAGRRVRQSCGYCGRSGFTAAWSRPVAVARWARWAVVVAIAVPGFYALTRWCWALGIPFGIRAEGLREEAEETPGIWLAGACLATLAVGGGLLTLGLIQRWGEIYPRWIPWLRGKRVHPRTAIVPASLVAVLVTSAGLMGIRAEILGYLPEGSGLGGPDWGTTTPGLLWPLWGLALGAATLAYYLRRRGQCARCGEG